jgi:hypothetical protein
MMMMLTIVNRARRKSAKNEGRMGSARASMHARRIKTCKARLL